MEVAVEGQPLKFVSLEDFVAMKVFAGGPQDISDAKCALEVALEPVNLGLLRKLAAGYGSQTARSLENLLGNPVREKDSGLEL